MNLNLILNREKDKGVSSQSAQLTDEVLVLYQKFNGEPERNNIILDLEQANALRKWLNKNLPR